MPTINVPRGNARALRLGFVALTDAAPLVVAQELGHFRRRGLAVELGREVGWATIRDKIAYGELDAAHAPAPMLWSARLGLGCTPVDVCTAFVFNLHGNALTLSHRLWQAGVRDASTLRDDALRRRGENKLLFGVDFTHTMHHLMLRQWLRHVRLDPERDVRIAVVPPGQMYRCLAAGTLDGYCAGEPWNTLAVQQQVGWCPAWSASLAPGHVEKVLMVRQAFADRRQPEHAALVAALTEAAAWCDEPANRAQLAQMLSAPTYLNLPVASIEPALCSRFDTGSKRESVPDFIVFHQGDANAPTAERAESLQRELVASGLVPRSLVNASLPRRLFCEDIHREATANLDPPAPPQLKIGSRSLVST